jgi:antitoxin CcdA
MRIVYAYPISKVLAMQTPFDPEAPRKAANLSVNADLLSKARELGINLSATLERALVATLRDRRREHWLSENREAIDAYNAHIDQHGVFSDELRSF